MTSKTARKYGLAASRSLLIILFAAIVAAPAHAQDPSAPPPPPPHERHAGEMQERQLEHMTKALDLTPDQVTQVKAIQADTRQQMIALHQDTSVDDADKQTRVMAIRQSQQAKIRALLNDEQKAKFDTMQQRMQERGQGRPRGGDDMPPPPPPSAA